MANAEFHINDEDLAALVEGNLEESRRAEARAHMARCRRCLAAYAEAVRFGARDFSGASLPPTSASVLRRAYAVAQDRGQRALGHGGRRALRWAGATASLAAAAAIVAIVVHQTDSGPGLHLNPAQSCILRVAVEHASLHEMIIPGGEGLSGGGQRSHRDATPVREVNAESTAAAIAELAAAGEGNRLSPEEAVWLVASLAAAGRTTEARASLQRSRAAGLADPRLQHLEAVLAYLDGDLASAEALLRRLLAEQPDDPLVAFNLGYLLDAQQRINEARPLLEAVTRQVAGTPLAERAAEILRSYE